MVRYEWIAKLNQNLNSLFANEASYRTQVYLLTSSFILILAGLTIYIGPLAQSKYAWDIPLLFDGAHRILNGLAPHTDYSSPIGLIPQAWLAAAMLIVNSTSADALAISQALWLLISASIAFMIGYQRLRPLAFLAFLLLVSALAIAACYPDKSPLEITYAGIYNRHGWSLFLILVVYVMIPMPNNKVEDFIIGLVLVALMLIKLNVAAASAVVILSGLLLGLISKQKVIRLSISAVVVLTVLIIGLGYNPISHLQDSLGLLFVERENSVLWNMYRRLEKNALIIVLSILALFYCMKIIHSSSLNKHHIRLLISIWFSGVLLSAGNSDGYYLPFLGLSLVTLISKPESVVYYRNSEYGIRAYFWGLILMAHLAGLIFFNTALGFYKTTQLDSSTYFINSLPVPDNSEPSSTNVINSNQQYREYLNSGLKILSQQEPLKSQSILVADWINPFNWLLDIKPMSNDFLFWHVGHVVDTNNSPNFAKFVDSSSFLMQPKLPIQFAAKEFILNGISPYLKEQFILVSENDYWLLYAKKQYINNK